MPELNQPEVPPPTEPTIVGLRPDQRPAWGEITIRCFDGEKRTCAAVYGPFGVHVNAITWEVTDDLKHGYRFYFTVTHIPSGKSMFTGLTNLEAHQVAVELWTDSELTTSFEAESPDFESWSVAMKERWQSIRFHAAHDFGLLFGDEDGDA